MRGWGLWLSALFTLLCSSRAIAATLVSCSDGARLFSACELTFTWNDGEVTQSASPYTTDLLHVEFRAPSGTTYLIRSFWDGGRAVYVRFTPTETGRWNYKVSSTLARYDNQEVGFNVSETRNTGFVSVANLRHWWTPGKKPHLWVSASVPLLEIDQTALEAWLDARKHDGFTHIRGTLLASQLPLKPLTNGTPNSAYFQQLDDRILAANSRNLTTDIILADSGFVRSGALNDWQTRENLMRYVVARYGSLNVTWQGIEHFEDTAGARDLLKNIGALLEKYDGYQHPRSTDARMTSSPLLPDGWMSYLIEASPHPDLGAVEHQFTQEPEIHVVTSTAPEAFRKELWESTTSGEYPTVSYEALENPTNVAAMRVWCRVMSGTRHWEFEPYFDVTGARAVGLPEVEFLAYAAQPGNVDITLTKHKYNPVWVNPITGEELPLKNYRGEVFSSPTPDTLHDWILQVPREGHKESMLHSYYFESVDPPVQEPEMDPEKTPVTIQDPSGDEFSSSIPIPFQAKVTRAIRATRQMQYVWWGELVGSTEGGRVLGVGATGNFTLPPEFRSAGGSLTVRLLAINALGKAYELDRVYRLGR